MNSMSMARVSLYTIYYSTGCAVVNGGCEHTCVNTGGSFYCDCDDGYEVDSDGLSCNGM